MADASRPDPADTSSGHAFISYAREDSPRVSRLRARLEEAGVPVWMDTHNLAPGDFWQDKIEHAISEDAFVFIACFSAESIARPDRFQVREIEQAIRLLRKWKPANPWLIPVRFSDCAIPDQDIGGRMLSDISYVDIFGDREEEGIEQLIEAALGIVRHDADSPGKYVTARATERPRIIDTVTVAAEWVLWGKGRDDRTYHVLRCSSGEFSPQDFSEVLGRYSPGTLERLPEVAFGWIPDNRTSQNYLAICIYEEGADSHGKIIDLAGRQVMHTRIFCVRYSELAKQHLTYRAMFEGFRGFRLLTGDLEPVRAELAAEPVPPVGGWMHELALNVAALLLTAKPVCILGADMIVLYDRLLFIDIVMSLLPYGLRSAMSAATWVRTRDHKFRLFFAANQGERDLAVSWGRPESRYTDDADAQMYLRWLEAAGPQAAEHTASQYRPMRFDKSEIHEMIARLPLLLNPRTALTLGLEFMSRALRDGDSASLAYYMDTLFGRPHEVFSDSDRRRNREIIKRYRLFAERPSVPRREMSRLYENLLRLAFDTPLTYEDFLQVEECLGEPISTRRELLTIMSQAPLTEITRLLVSRYLGYSEGEILTSLADQEMSPARAISLLTEDMSEQGRIKPEHGRIAFDLLVSYLFRFGQATAAKLKNASFLAPVLSYLYRENPGAQVQRLAGILRNIYGEKLTRPQIAEILGQSDCLPTPALAVATAAMADEGDLRFTQNSYVRRLAAELPRRQAKLTAARVLGREPWHVTHRNPIVFSAGLVVLVATIVSILLTL